ncbi:MAG: RNA polymerase sigma factor [Oscillibacter sp.]
MLAILQMLEDRADQDKFEALYHAYRGLLFYVANRILQNTQDAEDAVQQTFLKIAENLEAVAQPVHPKTRALVAIIAERTAIDLYRAKQRHPTVDLDELPLFYTDQLPEEGSLSAAITALPSRYRQVILLKYHLGYSNGEIGALLGCTPEGISQIAHRAKEKLTIILEQKEDAI